MKAFSIFAPPGTATAQGSVPPSAAERLTFVKDGFSWPALFFPILWILWHRLWLTLVWYVVAVLVVAWIGRLAGETNATLLAVLGGVLFAWEANNIRRWSLSRRGWREIGGASGRSLDEAEIRFFGALAGEPPAAATTGPAASAHPAAIAPRLTQLRRAEDDGPVLGLFPEPGA